MTKILEELPIDNEYRISSAHKRAAEMIDAMVSDAKKAKEPVLDIINLTPAIASVLLSRNPANRKLYPNTVAALIQAIEAGNWHLNGEPIIVSDGGELNDGQHRCEAVIQSGKPIRTAIIVGVPRDSRTTLDQGRARTAADYLHMLGFVNASTLAAAANFAWLYTNDRPIEQAGMNHRASRSDVIRFAQDHPALLHSIASCNSREAKALGSVAMFGFCHYALSRVARREDVETFFAALFEGANLGHGSPILYCRARLMTLKFSSKSAKRGSNTQPLRIELVFRCWNLWRRGHDNVTQVPLTGRLPELEA